MMPKGNCQKSKDKYSKKKKVEDIYKILNIMNNNLLTNKLKVSLDENEKELVFKLLLSNGNIGIAKLPINNIETLSSDIVLSRPIMGISYEPLPSDYNSLSPLVNYYNTDFTNIDFRGLWSPIDNDKGIGRNDVGIISAMHFNTIKLYNWNPARNHDSFLNYCNGNNIKVIVPISNFFVDNFSTQQENIRNIIKQANHPAVIAFAIGNEKDILAVQNIANIIKMINGFKPCCSPVKLSDFPNIPQAIFQALDTSIEKFNKIFFQAVNVYPPPNNIGNKATHNLDLVINNLWPSSQFRSQYLLISEYGWNSFSVSEQDQELSIRSQISFIKQIIADPSNNLFLGGILFEFSDKLWKHDDCDGFDNNECGLYKLSNNFRYGHTTGGQQYPINDLIPKIAIQIFSI